MGEGEEQGLGSEGSMKFEFDRRDVFVGLRLYPETNREMAELEIWHKGLRPEGEIERIVNDGSINYLIRFKWIGK